MTKKLKDFSWQQKLVLRAAQSVDYLEFDTSRKSNLKTGVYRSLVMRGFLQHHKYGWELTPEGRALNLWWNAEDREQQMRLEWSMSHMPRFFIRKSDGKWLVMDRLRIKERNNDPVHILRTRREARDTSRRLNVAERDDRGEVDGLVPTHGEAA